MTRHGHRFKKKSLVISYRGICVW